MYKVKSHSDRYLVELSQNHMNTTFRLRVSVPQSLVGMAERELEKILSRISELESKISEFRPGSDVFLLKLADVGQAVRVSSDTLSLLETSAEVGLETEHAYNPAFRSEEAGLLSHHFSWDLKTQSVTKRSARAALGFGAIGKGYALDFASSQLTQAGINHYCLDAGGSSLVIAGVENTHVPWTMGLSSQKENENYLGYEFKVIESPVFIGVSGTLEQGEHIVQSASIATASEKNIIQVLLTARSAARADALSTAMFANPTLAEKYVEGAILLIDNKGGMIANPKFKTAFQ